jgi:hypothetical protein
LFSTLSSKFQKLQEAGQEIDPEEKALYDNAVRILKETMPKPTGAAATPVEGAPKPEAVSEDVIDLNSILSSDSEDALRKLNDLKVGQSVKLANGKVETWTDNRKNLIISEINKSKVAPVTGIPDIKPQDLKLPSLTKVPNYAEFITPATKGSKYVVKSEDPLFLAAYPNGVDLQAISKKQSEYLTKQAYGLFDEKLKQAQQAGNTPIVRRLVDAKDDIISEFVADNWLTNPTTKLAVKKAMVRPLAARMMELTRAINNPDTDKSNLPSLSTELNRLEKARKKLDKEVDSVIEDLEPQGFFDVQ